MSLSHINKNSAVNIHTCEYRMNDYRCFREQFKQRYDGRQYCVLHYPDRAKVIPFNKVVDEKIKAGDYNFRGVWFPEEQSFERHEFEKLVDFAHATFSKKVSFYQAKFKEGAKFFRTTFCAETDFSKAEFEESINFKKADFSRAAFHQDVKFLSAKFKCQAEFSSATFRAEADFSQCKFKEEEKANFSRAAFRGEVKFLSAVLGHAGFSFTTFRAEADFSDARFVERANFSRAAFHGEARFLSAFFKDADFSFATFRDHVSFYSVKLRLHWFVNVEARKFDFTGAQWQGGGIEEELNDMKSKQATSPYVLLSKAYREIAISCEEAHRYEDASKFRHLAMDVRRRERWGGLGLWRLNWWYWLASGYGERVWRAFAVLLIIYLTFFVAYMLVGFEQWQPVSSGSNNTPAYYVQLDGQDMPLLPRRALSYSLEVMTLQRPVPRPATPTAHMMVTLETILGPLQAALLALALRRKFMR